MGRHSHPPKRAFDYEPGEVLHEGENYSPGRIMSMRVHPKRPIVYFLCRSDADEYTILTALADAACEPAVARNIPAEVMEELFMDAFVGYVLPKPVAPERMASRVPVAVDTHYATRSSVPKDEAAGDSAGDDQDVRESEPGLTRRWVPAIGPA
jgi:hypothetical protein